MTSPRPIPHATEAGYRRGCRCDECRIAHRQAQAAWVKRNRQAGRQPPTHGTLNGYINYGCRCEACTTARRNHGG